MKVILAGHEGSKQILSASSYLLAKYLKGDFDVYFLNYGKFSGYLSIGKYVSLDEIQQGGNSAWSKYMADYLKTLTDEFIVFALDDYLLSGHINDSIYQTLVKKMIDDDSVVCARLCTSSFYKDYERITFGYGLIVLTKDAEYSCTTQYCIWRREFLIELLGKVDTPWHFEIHGSWYLNESGKKVIGSKLPAMQYPDCSALSSKWPGVRVIGNKGEDLNELLEAGYLNKETIHG